MGGLRRPKPGGITVAIPEGLDWFLWRVLTHERNRSTLAEIETHWSLSDLLDAHLALDVHDELDHRVHEDHKRRIEEAERKARRSR